MGLYDRGYMNGTEESTQYSGRRYSAVLLLIGINAIIWFIWQFAKSGEGPLSEFMQAHFLLNPDLVVNHHYYHTLLTCAFSHIDPMHIIFNMLFFYYVAEDVENIYGFRNMLWLYVFCALASSLAFLGLEAYDTGGHLREASPMLGASGAVMGVVLVGAIFDPNKPMSIFGFIPVTLRTLVIIYIVLDIAGLTNRNNHVIQSRVANIAHLGGAFSGWLFWKLDLRMFSSPGRAGVGFWNKLKNIFRRKPRLRVVEKPVPEEMPRETVAQSHSTRASAGATSSRTSSRVDAATAERVDQLLDKIHKNGIQNLTDEERDFLNRSSQKYKRD